MKISLFVFVIYDMITQEKIQKPYLVFEGVGGLVGEEGDKLPKISN